MAIIAPQPQSLRGLIRDRYYRIPLYQRPYNWEIDEVSELWDDINKNDSGYFLGIVLFKPGSSKVEELHPTEFEIVDGQQRLSTLLLLLRAGVESLDRIGDKVGSRAFQKEYITQYAAGVDESAARLTLVLSKRDEKKFECLLRGTGETFSSKQRFASWKNLDNAIDFFRKKFDELVVSEGKSGLINFLNDKVLKLSFIEILLKTDSDVYQFFETINDRGMALSIADLVKNRVCSETAKQNKSVEDSVRAIDDVSEEIGSKNLKNFLLHYCWANDDGSISDREKDKVPTPRRKLMDWYGKWISRYKNISTFLDHLEKYSDYYTSFVDPSKCDDRDKNTVLSYLDALNASRCYPLLLVGEANLKKKDFVRLCKAVEILTARHSTILKRDAKVLEGVFYKLLGRIRKNNKKEIDGDFLEVFRTQESMKIDEQFKQAFIDLSAANHKVAKYILLRIEDNMVGTRQVPLPWKDLTVEHILAEKLNWDGREEYLERIGNLTLLSQKLNSDASNKSFKEKKDKDYKKDERIKITKELLKYSDFTKDTIVERQKELAKSAVTIWSAKNIQ